MSRGVYASPYVTSRGFKLYKNPYQQAANEWATWDESGVPVNVSLGAAVFIGEGIRLLLPPLAAPLPPPG